MQLRYLYQNCLYNNNKYIKYDAACQNQALLTKIGFHVIEQHCFTISFHLK